MDSHWSNENNIEGLYNVRERNPVNIYNGLNTNTPESYVFEEELEDIASSCENHDFQSGPDLDLIHQMLHLVKDVNMHKDISEVTDTVIEISKFPTSSQASVGQDNDVEKLLKKKKRNVAIESILEGISTECNLLSLRDDIEFKNTQQVKLLKPDHFILTSECSQVSEVNDACDKASAFVFKKKSPDLAIQDNDSPKFEPKSDSYQPSSMAEVYYKKYLERSKFKERMQQSTEEFYEKIQRNEDLESVQLPYHRHLLVQDCIVCNIICRKFFQ